MSITYSTAGLTQQDDTASGNTLSQVSSSSAVNGTTTLTFSSLGFTTTNSGSIVVVGKVITSPANLAGALVTSITPAGATTGITSVTVNRSLAGSLGQFTTITFADSDHILSGSTGLTLTDTGTYPNRTRLITLTGTGLTGTSPAGGFSLAGLGPTTAQFVINGTFFNDARWNTYTITSVGAATQRPNVTTSSGSGIKVLGTFNSLNTSDNTLTGNANGTGSITFRPSNQAAAQDSIGAPIYPIGNVNLVGTGYYGNNYWTLDGNGTTGCTVSLTNSILRTGTATNQSLISCYSDAYGAATTFAGRHTFNINNSNVVDTYLKFLAVKPTSQFNNVRWYKTVPQTSTLATNLDIAIAVAPALRNRFANTSSASGTGNITSLAVTNTGVASAQLIAGVVISSPAALAGVTILTASASAITFASTNVPTAIPSGTQILAGPDTVGFNFTGPTFGLTGNPNSYYNTHIALGTTSSNGNAPTAVRCTVYGYETSIQPRIGKVVDFPSVRPWIEGRKNLSLTINKPNGTPVGSNDTATYLEDSNLNTGQLATVAIFGATGTNAGYTNGTYNSAVAIGGGGTGGTVRITVTGNQVTNAEITAVGSGYTATSGTGIVYAVNNTNFPGAGAGSGVSLVIYPYIRYGAYATGNTPSFTDNQTYTASTNGSGLLASSSNPVKGDGTAAYSGVDFLLWAANAAYPDAATNWGSSQFLVPIDQRFSANGATNYSISVPLRSYLYEDVTYTLNEANGGGATAQATSSVTLADDVYAVGTGITQANAANISAVTLVAPAPTRNATTGALIPSTTGTLTISGTTTLTSNQVYAKAKSDYTRPLLNSTAGNAVRTGFGVGPFLTGSGVVNTATANLDIGSWGLTTTAPIQAGVFGTLSTTGNATLNYANNAAGTTYPLGSYAGITAALVNYGANATVLQPVTATGAGAPGTPASWTTNSTLGAGTGASTFTAGIPANLISGVSSITTGSVTITGTGVTDQTTIQTALQSALNAAMGNTSVSVSVNQVTGTAASFQITIGTGFAANGGSTGSLTFSGTSGTNTIVGVSGVGFGSFATEATVAANFATALNTANTGFWTATVSGAVITVTAAAANGGPKWGTLGVTAAYSPNPFSGIAATITSTTPGIAGANNLMATFTGNTPAVGGVVPTTALTLTSSLANYITGTSAATNLVNSVAGSNNNLTYPTTGTVINTTGTITGIAGTTTATGSVTVTGGFRQGSFTGTSVNPLAFALPTSTNFTLTGVNTLDSGLNISGGSTGLITLGQATDTSSSRTTYGANTSQQHTVQLTGSTAGGTVTVNSGLMSGGTTQCGLTVTGNNVNLGSGLDSTGSVKLSVAGQTTATGNIVTINGMQSATAGGTIAFQAEALTNGTLGGTITATNLTLGGSGIKNFLLNTATNPGSMTFTNCSFGPSTGGITFRNRGGTVAFNNCTTPAVILNGDTPGTMGVAGGSQLTGGIDSFQLGTLLITGGSTVGLLNLTNASAITLGNAAGSAILTNGGAITNSTKNTTYSIGNLDLTGNLTIAQAPASAYTLTPTITMRTGSTFTIDCGSSNNLTINCANVTFANAGATFARVGTGTIQLLNWPATKAVPTGFVANVTTAVTLTFTDTPATAPTIRVAEAYKNAGSTNILAGVTPTYANGIYTWTFSSSIADTINGAVFMVDGYQIARGTSANATMLSATAVPETNVDFGQTLVAADTAFISTTSWDATNAFFSVNPYVSMTTSSTVTYTTTPTTRTAVELGKIVIRRTLETTDAGTVEMRRAMAFGTLAVSFISFTQTGLSVNQVAGLATSGVGLKINKVSNAASQNAVITWAIWAVDNLGDFYNLNTANGRNPTTPTTLILWEGFSPGAVANLTTGQINQIGAGVGTALNSTFNALGTLVAKASKLIPGSWTTLGSGGGGGGAGGAVENPVTPEPIPTPPAAVPLTWTTHGGATTYVASEWAGSGGFSDWVAEALRSHLRGTASTLFSSFTTPASGVEGWYTATTTLNSDGREVTYAVFVASDGNIASQNNSFDNTYDIITSTGAL